MEATPQVMRIAYGSNHVWVGPFEFPHVLQARKRELALFNPGIRFLVKPHQDEPAGGIQNALHALGIDDKVYNAHLTTMYQE